MMFSFEKMIDISQPISSKTAVYPGDTPFHYDLEESIEKNGSHNLTAFTMSPHVGTHTDAPAHVVGSMKDTKGLAGTLSLEPFLGPCKVIDLAPYSTAISIDQLLGRINKEDVFSKRLLFKTRHDNRYDVFENEYAFFSFELIEMLHRMGVLLVGLDTPSVDDIHAKELRVHHELISKKISWLENLDLTKAAEGSYYLIALPLKLMEVEASPVRAILIPA